MFQIKKGDTICMFLLFDISLVPNGIYQRGPNAQSRNLCPTNKTKISTQVKISAFLRNKHNWYFLRHCTRKLAQMYNVKLVKVIDKIIETSLKFELSAFFMRFYLIYLSFLYWYQIEIVVSFLITGQWVIEIVFIFRYVRLNFIVVAVLALLISISGKFFTTDHYYDIMPILERDYNLRQKYRNFYDNTKIIMDNIFEPVWNVSVWMERML